MNPVGLAWPDEALAPEPTPSPVAATSPETFVPIITAIRWATTAAALLLLLSAETRDTTHAVAGAVVLTYALLRTIRPVDVTHGRRAMVLGLLLETAVMVGAVVSTDYWSSPFALGILTVVGVAGFAGGIHLAVPTAAVCLLAVALPYHFTEDGNRRLTVTWGGELLLVGMVTGYARHLTVKASEKTTAFMSRLQRLSEANSLLLQLHHVATTLPMTLDLEDTLESSVTRLRELFEPDSLAILVKEEDAWSLMKSSGVTLPASLAHTDLPPVLRDTCLANAPRLLAPIDEHSTTGLSVGSRCGLYAPLWARNELVGVVALERRDPDGFAAPQLALMDAFVEQMAVAIDNARWFARIGTLAAEQERTRIARDLHDRVGQSLALVGFELDRAAKSRTEEDLRRQIGELRETVKAVVGELRETLYDLRTDVSEERDLGAALGEYLDRVRRRTALDVDFVNLALRRLPLTIEREVWRIAQEAVTNVERHASAARLRVRWTTDADGAVLTVDDDGVGMPAAKDRRRDGYGMLGMQERADAVGATLTITSVPDEGTSVRVEVRR